MSWVKIGKEISKEGSTITYARLGTDYTIESRKRHIAHAGGRPGTWDHTTYFVLLAGRDLIEKMSLSDAKEFAELHMKDNNNVQ